MYEFVGNYDAAITQLDLVMKLAKQDSQDYLDAARKKRFLIASNHAKNGELDVAIEQFNDLIRDYPDDYLLYYSLGIAYLLHRDFAEAEKALKKSIQLNPAYAGAYLSLATVYESMDDQLNAYETLDKVASGRFDASAVREAGSRMKMIEARLLLDQAPKPI